MGSIPRVDGVTVLRLRRPIRHFPRSSAFHPGSPLAYCPRSVTCLRKLPVFRVEDSSRMMEVACYWLPRPLSAASQSPYRVGQVDLYGRCHAEHGSDPYSGLVPTISGLTGWHHRQGMPGSRFPVGLYTLQVMHQVIPQPRTTSWGLVSPAWRLSGACCSRHRVVYGASLQGLMGYLYTQRCFHMLPHRLHGAQRRRSGGYWASAPVRG